MKTVFYIWLNDTTFERLYWVKKAQNWSNRFDMAAKFDRREEAENEADNAERLTKAEVVVEAYFMMKEEPKVKLTTPWYPCHTTPLSERPGVYKTIAVTGIKGFSYWDGNRWSVTFPSVNLAAEAIEHGASHPFFTHAAQTKFWCGLKEKS